MRALIALLLLVGSVQAQTPPTIRINFVYTPGAVGYMSGINKTPQQFIQGQVDKLNDTLAVTGVNGRVEIASISLYDCCKNWLSGKPAANTTQAADNMAMDYTLANMEHVANADMTVAFTDLGGAGESQRRWVPADALKTIENSVMAVDALAADLGNKFVHSFGHALGAGHQASGGFEDNTLAGPDHGWWLKTGNNEENCEVAYTVMADSVVPTIAVTCNAFFFGTEPMCSAQAWCDRRALAIVQTPTFSWARNPFGTLLNSGTPQQACFIQAYDSFGVGPWGIETDQLGLGTLTTFDMTCPNKKALNVFSNPNLTYKLQPMGGPGADNRMVLNFNFPIKATTRIQRRDLLVKVLQARILGVALE